jgi:MSHA pilin protein MshD
MEEVSSQPFTYCDPTDANATTATSATVGGAGCAATVQGLGPGGTGQTRPTTTGGTPSTFNNVPDYSGLATITPVWDVSGSHQYPAGYSATITITAGDALGPSGATISPNDNTALNLNLLRIGVTVSRTGSSESVTLEGYRARHSPNAVP